MSEPQEDGNLWTVVALEADGAIGYPRRSTRKGLHTSAFTSKASADQFIEKVGKGFNPVLMGTPGEALAWLLGEQKAGVEWVDLDPKGGSVVQCYAIQEMIDNVRKKIP